MTHTVDNEERGMGDEEKISGGVDSRGTSQTSVQKQGLQTRGAACQRATLETPLCPELVGDPWKPEHSGDNVWKLQKRWELLPK